MSDKVKDSDLIGRGSPRKGWSNISAKQRNVTIVTIFIAIFAIIVAVTVRSNQTKLSFNKSSITAPSPLNNSNQVIDDKVRENLNKLVHEKNESGAKNNKDYIPIVVGDLKKPPTIEDVAPPIAVVQTPVLTPQQTGNTKELQASKMIQAMQQLQASWLGAGGLPSKIVFTQVSTTSIGATPNSSGMGNLASVINQPSDLYALTNNGNQQVQAKLFIKAGETLYARSKMEINSDYGGAVVLEGIDNRIKGITIIADGFTTHDVALTISPTRMIMPDRTVSISSYALNPKTDANVVASEVNTHFFERWGSFVLAIVMDGLAEYANIVQQQGVAITSNLAGLTPTVTSTPVYSVSQQGWIIGGRVMGRTANIIRQHINVKNTVYIHKNDIVKLLFINNVYYTPIKASLKNSIPIYQMGRLNY